MARLLWTNLYILKHYTSDKGPPSSRNSPTPSKIISSAPPDNSGFPSRASCLDRTHLIPFSLDGSAERESMSAPDETYHRTQAERCRRLARQADEPIASALNDMAAEHELKARQLGE